MKIVQKKETMVINSFKIKTIDRAIELSSYRAIDRSIDRSILSLPEFIINDRVEFKIPP